MSEPHSDTHRAPRAPRRTRRRLSLGVRYVALIVVLVIVTGSILAVAVTLQAVRTGAQERQRSLEYAARVVAATLLPVVADQDPQRIQAQLEGILATGERHEIECIELIDASGVVIAETEPECTCDEVEETSGMIAMFTEPQVVRVPIEIDGLQVATVSVQFRPVGLVGTLTESLTTALVVLTVAMVVSAAWGGWMVLRTVVEPIEDLRDAASGIAQGSRDISLDVTRGDEIGDLATTLQEMTEQLDAREQELRDSYESLETAFHDKAELARRLERTIHMRSDFVATASHEIRSPLAVIRLYAEMLEDNQFGDVDPVLDDAIEAIVDAVSRLSSIVSSMLDVALLERGLMQLEYLESDVRDLVEQAVTAAQNLYADTGIRFELVSESEAIDLYCDPVRLRQVMDNLLSNAVKYSAESCKIRVEVRVDGANAYVSVTDHGVGIPEERADVLFELFGRADTADNAQVAGLGLGLAISDRVVKAHGGEITFEPNSGGIGTTFTVRLPLEPGDAMPDAVPIV